MEYSEQRNTVRMTASFTLRKKHNLRLRPIKDLVIKFPIPSSWSSLFLADTKFGEKKSVRSTSSLRGSFRRKIKSHDCQIETVIGSAKYEPENGAILWRIGHYIESTLPHNFRCDMQLKSGETGYNCWHMNGRNRSENKRDGCAYYSALLCCSDLNLPPEDSLRIKDKIKPCSQN